MLPRLKLQQALFPVLLVVSLLPVMILTIWVQRTALDREMSAVEEKHLLLARNLTGALKRYATDVKAVFLHTTDVSEHHRFGPDVIRLARAVNILGVVKLKRGGGVDSQLFGDRKNFGPDLLKALDHRIREARLKPNEVILSDVVTRFTPSPLIFLFRHRPDIGTWVGAVDTTYIVKLQRSISFGEKGHACIVDRSGRVLAHPRKEWRLEPKDLSQVPPVMDMMNGKTGVSTFFSPAAQAEMIAGYAAVEQIGWGVMIPQPISELRDHVADIKRIAMLVGAFGVMITAMLSWLLSGRLASPISRLANYAEAISVGNFKAWTGAAWESTVKELNSLIGAFDRMASEIERNQAELEQRVKDRTLELRKEIENRVAAEEKVRYLATHDPVTGLPNRVALDFEIRASHKRHREPGHILAVIFLDLDGFKMVNDHYGHAAGDGVLLEVGKRLARGLRHEDIVVRYGGDEFVVLLGGQKHVEDVRQISKTFCAMVTEPLWVKGIEINIGASVGVAVAPAQTADINKMLRQADLAMYQAKKDGDNSVYIFNEAKADEPAIAGGG